MVFVCIKKGTTEANKIFGGIMAELALKLSAKWKREHKGIMFGKLKGAAQALADWGRGA